jgi:hypothetical protein
VTVVFDLPPSSPPKTESALERVLDAQISRSPWATDSCASWRSPAGDTSNVKPTVNYDETRTRLICRIPAIGNFTSLTVGAEVTASQSLASAPLVGRSAITVFSLTQPYLTPSDDPATVPPELQPIDHQRLVAWTGANETFEQSAPYPRYFVGELSPGVLVPLVFVEEGQRSAGQIVVQLMWILVGLLGGWIGIAAFRAAMPASALNHDSGDARSNSSPTTREDPVAAEPQQSEETATAPDENSVVL